MGEKRKTPMRKLPVRRREFFISNFGITRVRGRRFLLLKARGCILSGRYFLNAPVYRGQTEESLSGQPTSPPCFDSYNPLS